MLRYPFTLLALGACEPREPDTDPPDTDPADTDVAPACDFSAFAGDWAGDMHEGDAVFAMTLTLEPTAALDALVGHTWFDLDSGCDAELTCLGLTQLDAYVVNERVTRGNCFNAYVFLRPEDDGTLTFDEALSEFGEHVTTASLTRAD